MDRLNELASRLTQADLKVVVDFAEFLLDRQRSQSPSLPSVRPGKINFQGWAGCLAHVDMTAVELSHQANDLMVAWAMKEG